MEIFVFSCYICLNDCYFHPVQIHSNFTADFDAGTFLSVFCPGAIHYLKSD